MADYDLPRENELHSPLNLLITVDSSKVSFTADHQEIELCFCKFKTSILNFLIIHNNAVCYERTKTFQN